MDSLFEFKGDLLPAEIIIKIYSNLSLNDIKNSSLTCKHWLRASMDKSVMKKRVLVLYHEKTHCHWDEKRQYLQSESTFPYNNMIMMDDIVQNFKNNEFWQKYCYSLELLKIYVPSSLEKMFEILKDMKQLNTLELIYLARVYLKSKLLKKLPSEIGELRNMKVLKISLPIASDRFHMVPNFLKMMPNLVHIELDFISYDVYKTSYELDAARLNVRKELFDYLNKGKDRIKILILKVDVDTWDLISTIQGMKLETFAIYCQHIVNAVFPSPVLTIGSFTDGNKLLNLYTRITDLMPICNYFPNLETITFNCSTQIENINEIKKLKHLKNLAVDDCSESLLEVLSEYPNVLESLNLRFNYFRYIDAKISFKNLTNLTYLSCHHLNYTTDQDIQTIWKYLKQLRQLHIRIDEKSKPVVVTDFGFTGVNTTTLETDPNQTVYSISDLLYLQKLSIQIFPNSIGEQTLSHISKCEKLDYLHINYKSVCCKSRKIILVNLKQSCPLLKDDNICINCNCYPYVLPIFELKLFPERDIYISEKDSYVKTYLKAKYHDNYFDDE